MCFRKQQGKQIRKYWKFNIDIIIKGEDLVNKIGTYIFIFILEPVHLDLPGRKGFIIECIY